MKKVKVMQVGKTADNRNWFRLSTTVHNYDLTGFLISSTLEHKVDEEIEIPTAVYKSIKWQS